MNQVFAGTAAVLLTILLWSFGKKPGKSFEMGNQQIHPKKFLSANPNLVIGSIHSKNHPKSSQSIDSENTFEQRWQPPQSAKEKVDLKKKLANAMRSGPQERLEAVIIAGLWDNKSSLSILKRGLKDSERDVVLAAATALEKKKYVYGLSEEKTSPRPPRNVALMR